MSDFPGGSEVKASAYNTGDLGLIPGSGISPGEGNGKPLQYLCLIYINKVVKILEKKKEVRGNSGNSERLIWGAPKSLQMVTAAMKLKTLTP